MTGARETLESLRHADLQGLHASGTCPDLSQLTGVLDGAVLTGSLAAPGIRVLRAWRGKVFHHDARSDRDAGTDETSGLNRLGVAGVEWRRYRFTARRGTSLFGDRTVVLLDHDRPDNPRWVRRFHDELVSVGDGVYLATSHYRAGSDLRLLCYFALMTGGSS